jgi:hypothetical protein
MLHCSLHMCEMEDLFGIGAAALLGEMEDPLGIGAAAHLGEMI